MANKENGSLKKPSIPKTSTRIVGFCCKNALGMDEDIVEKGRLFYEPAVRIVELPCSSKVDTLGIIKAFESGADGVFVLGCPEETCRLLGGNHRAKKIVNHTKKLLKEIGIETGRLEMFQIKTPECENFEHVTKAMIKRVESLVKT